MRLFSFLTRSGPQTTVPDLRSQLIVLVGRKDLRGLAALVRQRRQTITDQFADWLTVPMAMKQDQPLLERYGDMLLSVARIVEREGDPSLIRMLEGDPADAPVESWNEQIAVAAALSSQHRYVDAARVLSTLADRLGAMRGSAVDFYRPRVLGKLGIALYQGGDVTRAREATAMARDICRELGDEDGVRAYETNLATMGEA